MKKLSLFLAILFLGMVWLFPLKSLAKVKGQENIFIGKDETINDNFVGIGSSVDIEGSINGDVIVAGGTVNIRGPVSGDVIAAGGTVKVAGEVKGNVRVAGGNVEINGQVGKNVNAFGGTVIIGEKADIGQSLSFGAGLVEIRGPVKNHIDGTGGNVILASKVGGNANIRLDKEGQLTLYPEAEIAGNLTYSGALAAEIREGAKVLGETVFKEIVPKKGAGANLFGYPFIFFRLLSLFGALVVGLVLISFFSSKVKEVTEKMWTSPWASLGWGFVYLIVVPVLIILLFVTLIGLPLGIMVLGFYLLYLYLARIFVGVLVGLKVLGIWQKKTERLFWPFILGMVIWVLITSIPVLGWLITLVGTVWALGASGQVTKKYLTPSSSSGN